MDYFNLIKVIGRGSYGKVLLCERKDTHDLFAIKCLKKDDILLNHNVESVKSERKILEEVYS